MGNIVYSENFGGTNLGIVIRNGIIGTREKPNATGGAVFYIDKNNDDVITAGPLELIEKHIRSPLKIIRKHKPMDVGKFITMCRSRDLTEEQRIEQYDYFRDILEKEDYIDTTSYTNAEGGRSRRRKSRRHKKTNHRRRKSNRRKSRRYKK